MQSYPSPSAAAADNGCPFYSSNNGQNQQQASLQSPEDLHLTAQLTSLAPIMGVGPNGTISENHVARGQSQSNVNHPYENERDQHTNLHPSPGSLDQLGGHYGTRDETLAPRKRTKVSRACDECRRKKIRCDATNDQNDEHCSNCKRVGARCQFSRVPMKRGPSKGYIKELADRLHTLEGAIHSGEIVHPYLSQGENSLPHRDSEEFSPPPNIDTFSRKRRISATTDFGPYLVQRPVVSWNSGPQETSRNLSHSSSDLISPNATQSVTQIFSESTHSPNSLQTAIWRNEPAHFRHLNTSFDDLAHDEILPKREIEFDNSILEAYYKMIQPTYCLLPYDKSKVFDQLESCPAPLSEAMHEAISVAVNSFLESNAASNIDNVKMRKTSQHVLVSSLENPTSRPLKVNIVNLQTMLLLAIAVENIALNHPKKTRSYSCSVWIGNTISLAYAMKLFLFKPKKLKDTDLDTDENVARRLWWSIYAMDRWSAASTSSPVLIPDTASVLYPDDLPLLGEVLWNLARLSTILGHISTINTVSSSLPPFSVPLASAYGATMKGELERVRESFPSIDCHPLVLMAYWHLRILVELQLVDSEPNDLLNITANAINHINRNSDFISPLRFHFIFLIILTLIDLLDYDMTKSQSEIELDSILVKQLISADWAMVVRTILAKKNSLVSDITTPLVHSQSQTQSQPQSLDVADAEQHNIDIENLVRLADLATAAGAKRESAPTKIGNSELNPCVTSSSPFRYYNWLREQVRSGFLNVFTQELARA